MNTYEHAEIKVGPATLTVRGYEGFPFRARVTSEALDQEVPVVLRATDLESAKREAVAWLRQFCRSVLDAMPPAE